MHTSDVSSSVIDRFKTPFHQRDSSGHQSRHTDEGRCPVFFGDSVRLGHFTTDHECLSVVGKGKKSGQTTRIQTAGTFQCLTLTGSLRKSEPNTRSPADAAVTRGPHCHFVWEPLAQLDKIENTLSKISLLPSPFLPGTPLSQALCSAQRIGSDG